VSGTVDVRPDPHEVAAWEWVNREGATALIDAGVVCPDSAAVAWMRLHGLLR
jgi:hypothetical protein